MVSKDLKIDAGQRAENFRWLVRKWILLLYEKNACLLLIRG
jgi:hypothetical protein